MIHHDHEICLNALQFFSQPDVIDLYMNWMILPMDDLGYNDYLRVINDQAYISKMREGLQRNGYLSEMENPIRLSTVRVKLRENRYIQIKDFFIDILRIFADMQAYDKVRLYDIQSKGARWGISMMLQRDFKVYFNRCVGDQFEKMILETIRFNRE